MRLKISHTTCYSYEVGASYALQQLRVRPKSNACQCVLDWKMTMEGAKVQASFTDQNDNLVDLVELDQGAKEVSILVFGEVETQDTNGITGPHNLAMPLWFYLRQTKLTKAGPNVTALLAAVGSEKEKTVSVLHTLSEIILDQAPYEAGQTSTLTTAEEALTQKSGVCQDHTHIFLSAARALGFPARYVSGYLLMDDRVDQDASHAWAEAYVDGLGWVGFDVSNGICPDQRYVQLARGLDYTGAAPSSGFVVGAQRENLIVSVQVQQ